MSDITDLDNPPVAEVSWSRQETGSLVLSDQSFDRIMNVAKVMATGKATVPKHLQGNQADCMAVIMQAMQWKMNPFPVAQKTHLINGVLGYEAQLVNAVVTAMAPTTGRIQYEWFGDWSKVLGKFREGTSKTKVDEDTGEAKKYRSPDWNMADEKGLGVRVWATMKGEQEPRVLELLLVQARTRNSTLWADDPKQQLAYLATKRWARLHCPDVIMGVYTPDELGEISPEKDITPRRPQRPAEIAAAAIPAAAEADSAERDALIELLQRAPTVAELEVSWKKVFSADERAIVGMETLKEIKAEIAAKEAEGQANE